MMLRPEYDPPHPCGDTDCTSADDDHDEHVPLLYRLLSGLGCE